MQKNEQNYDLSWVIEVYETPNYNTVNYYLKYNWVLLRTYVIKDYDETIYYVLAKSKDTKEFPDTTSE